VQCCLRVELADAQGGMTPPSCPLVPNLSLRKIAPSGVTLQNACNWSDSF